LETTRAKVILLKDYLASAQVSMLREPTGNLKYKYIQPGAVYQSQLWDWDSFFASVALSSQQFAGEELGEYIAGCVLNFLSSIREDGSIPYHLFAFPPNVPRHKSPLNIGYERRERDSPFNTIKPLLAQMLLLSERYSTECSIERWFPTLQRYIAHWEETQFGRFGLFVWRSHRGSGADNHPAVYGRPLDSSAGVDLNCFFVREYDAMSLLASRCGLPDAAGEYQRKRNRLIDAINRHMWDPMDDIYYHLDTNVHELGNVNQPVTWAVPLKFKAWTSFLPMWAKVAPPEYADSMVGKYLNNRQHFWSTSGIRTVSARESVYQIAPGGNPSNWQGPVWTISNYLVFRGLMNYGYLDAAAELMGRTVNLLADDVQRHGLLHECYDPDTGKGITNPGFLSWNLLAVTMWEEVENNKDFTDYAATPDDDRGQQNPPG
jgi:putative isomerase